MAAAQSELSMDEILASIRRIIHEEEDQPNPAAQRDTTNTVDLEEERKKEEALLADMADMKEQPAEQLREVQLTSAAAEPLPEQPKAEPEPEEDEPFISNQKIVDEAFDTASLKTLVREEVAARAKTLQEEMVVAEPDPESVTEPEPATEAVAEETVTEAPAPEAAPEPASAEPEPSVDETLITDTAATDVAASFSTLKQHVHVSKEGPKTLEDIVAEMMKPLLKAWLDENLKAIVDEKVDAEIKRLAGR